MLDFGPFCYLDVQKTGSTFIGAFLRKHIKLPAGQTIRHGSIKENVTAESKFYFISVRNPLSQYGSLYRFGRKRRGRFAELVRQNPEVDRLYAGNGELFSDWLRFVLAPENAELLGYMFCRENAEVYGFQTFRFLSLALPKPKGLMRRMQTRQDVVRIYRRRKLPRAFVRQERLSEDLMELCRGPLRPFLIDVDAATDDLLASQPTNTSPAIPLRLDEDARQRLIQAEWFLYNEIGYERPAGPGEGAGAGAGAGGENEATTPA